jgi:hypothetical protein
MTTTTSPRRAAWDSLEWLRAASGEAIRTQWRGWHLSLYRQRASGQLRFRLDGPVRGRNALEGKAQLWERLFRYLPVDEEEAGNG